MYINNLKRRGIKKIITYLIFILILIILLNGCIEDPINYCKKNDCTSCENDSDCTLITALEEMECCPGLCDEGTRVAINNVALKRIIELKNKWHKWHCFFIPCGERKLCTRLPPSPLYKAVKCVNNSCTLILWEENKESR